MNGGQMPDRKENLRLKESQKDIKLKELEERISQLDTMCQAAIQYSQLLEKCIASHDDFPPIGGKDMAKKIRRRVNINGTVQWINADTEQEYAENLMRAMGVGTGVSGPVNCKHDFEEYAWKWFRVFSMPNVDKVTAITYERQLRLYILPAFIGKNIEDITAVEIQSMFNQMDVDGSKSRATKDKTKMVLNMILQQAIEDDIIQKNPLKSRSLRIKGAPSKRTEPYTVQQMRYLAQHMDQIQMADDRNYLAFHLFHPFRLEEVLGLRWEDIDFENGMIHIRNTVTHPDRNRPLFREKTKTDESRRDIALVRQIRQFLTVGGPKDFVVGRANPMSYTQVQHMCRRIRKDVGFEENITPLRFRTTVLTDIYDRTKDIKQTQAAAGHTTAAMTLKYYIKGRGENDDAVDAIASAYGLL